MKVYVVVRFDPMQCGACGCGHLDKVFMTKQDAQAYISDSGRRRGVSWEIKERGVETHASVAVPA